MAYIAASGLSGSSTPGGSASSSVISSRTPSASRTSFSAAIQLLGVVLVQPDLAAAARQRIEQRDRRGVLGGDQVRLVQHPQPGGQFGVLGVEIRQQAGDGRVGRAASTGRRSSR